MIAADALASAVRRDRRVLLGGVAVVAGLAWLHMARMASGAAASCHGASSAAGGWSAVELGSAAAMWLVMMVGMMLPIVSPWLLALSRSARERAAGPAPFSVVGWFALGYATVWTGYSLLAAAGQLALHRAALLSPHGLLTNDLVACAVLGLAAVYQWSPFRDSCMTHCRSPFAFFVSSWRDGRGGAFSMGLRHGLYCAGCCWALMAVSFVFGVMSIAWMAGLTAFLLVEKIASAGPWLGRAGGVALAAAAAAVLARAA